MANTKQLLKRWAFWFVALTISGAAGAAPVATVNNVKIDSEMLDLVVANSVAQGAKDTPELRTALKNELIAREVLVQEAKKQNVDKDATFKLQSQIQQNALLVESLLAKQSAKVTITDEMLRAEYKRQTDLLADVEQYQVSHIVTASEADAKAVIKATKDGVAFDKLAREKSISQSAQNGGSLGWLLADQMVPALSNVVVNLSVGSVTNLPIATTEGWQVIKLEGKRKFKAPTFEESKQRLTSALSANQRAEFIQKLVKAAKVE